jgi:hypothetical protein
MYKYNIDKDLESFATRITDQLGSNTGGLYKINSTNKMVYIKLYRNSLQAYCEHLANNFYLNVGLKAPRSELCIFNKKLYYLSYFIQGTPLNNVKITKEIAKSICNDIIFDIFIANWDVIGMNYDNILLDETQSIYRIDNGASFLTRAQGTLKPTNLLLQITEWDNFFNSTINPTYSQLLHKTDYISVCNIDSIIKSLEKIKRVKISHNGWIGFINTYVSELDDPYKDILVKMMDSRENLLEIAITKCLSTVSNPVPKLSPN